MFYAFAYFAIALVFAVIGARLIYADYSSMGTPDPMDKAMAAFIGLLFSLVWPLVLVAALVYMLAFRPRKNGSDDA